MIDMIDMQLYTGICCGAFTAKQAAEMVSAQCFRTQTEGDISGVFLWVSRTNFFRVPVFINGGRLAGVLTKTAGRWSAAYLKFIECKMRKTPRRILRHSYFLSELSLSWGAHAAGAEPP